MKPLVIYGAGGHAREAHQCVVDCIAAGAKWKMLGFASADPSEIGREMAGLSVQAWSSWASRKVDVVIAIGSPSARRRVAMELRPDAGGFPTIVHPSVVRGARTTLGVGVFIAAGSVATVDISIGDFALINRSVNVSHDVNLGDFATVGPASSLSGAVKVGEGADLGTGVLTIPGVRIGNWTVVGAGAVVTRDVRDDVVVAGSPARVLRRLEPGWHDALRTRD